MPGDHLVNVKADSVSEFLDKSHREMRDPKKLGETTYDLTVENVKLDAKTRTVVKGNFALSTETSRVHWAGAQSKQPDQANLDAIRRVEAMNAAHEKNHRDSYQKAFDDNKAALEKELIGKTEKEIPDVLKKMKKKLKDACEKLHGSEGNITVQQASNGTFSISETAEGPGGCT